MENTKVINFIKAVIENKPSQWLNLTTHRLDIYNENLAKVEFLEHFEALYKNNQFDSKRLNELPTAYDYIRLGHPLSCVLEWSLSKLMHTEAENIISFSSKITPILSILRKNALDKKPTQIIYTETLPNSWDTEVIKKVYGYDFQLKKVKEFTSIPEFEGTTIVIDDVKNFKDLQLSSNIDFFIKTYNQLGSILLVNGNKNKKYISEIQHVRRRETIAMTPSNCSIVLQALVTESELPVSAKSEENKTAVLAVIKDITGTTSEPLIGSSGLSIQYAIMMGLIHDANENYQGKAIKFVVPPNCYGGTNDQARRVAACLDHVEVVDLPVDGDDDMVNSVDRVLESIAKEDALAYIIAEIPTNPRVEVPDLQKLKAVLSAERKTASGSIATAPVFILDQTFCPNVHFLGEGKTLSKVKTISYASGSKFPSGGRCTAGYCVGNKMTQALLNKIQLHLNLCDNEATSQQYQILAEQLPSMNKRINEAYKNTRKFVNFIENELPAAKINFVSEELAEEGFTPSVFSLDLPTKGNSEKEMEDYKRQLNLQLINLMISEIPEESKFCVSYGQLKGCYWTIPATSTQGTTKEGDKDYIVRASLSPNMDLERHKKVFLKFIETL